MKIRKREMRKKEIDRKSDQILDLQFNRNKSEMENK